MGILKTLGMLTLVALAVVAVLLTASTIHHTKQLGTEAKEFPPPGTMVEVNGNTLHVYTEGDGDTTLVFLAGHGTSNPTLDFKPLWGRLVDEYRIAVVERSGYGWSETSKSPRDLDTMLEETRRALELSGEQGPYVLFPHSMSGLEAIYWAQKHPDEVRAIIGLDPCTPGAVDILPEPSKVQLYVMYLVSRAGVARYMPESDVGGILPLIESNDLTEEDKQRYLAVFYKSAFTEDMLREVEYLRANAETVTRNAVPISTPMVFFISDGQEANVPGWHDALSGYLSKLDLGEYMELATGHYVHHEKADIIAEEAKAFLGDLD